MIMINETDYTDSGITSNVALPTSSSLPSESGYVGVQVEYNGPPPCTGCGQVILDQFILRVQNRLWHADCLRCAACQVSLTQDCFARGSRVYCQDDFFRLYGARCVGCCQPISPTEQVRRAHENIYHPGCFACDVCGAELETGDEFYLKDDGKLICRHDYDIVKDKEESDSGSDQPSPKRARIFISSEQTATLEKLYRRHKRPSWKTLEKVSKDTSLDVKTVQVWFKNQRATEKKTESFLPLLHDTTTSPKDGHKTGSSPAPIVNRGFIGNVITRDERRPPITNKADANSNKESYWSMSDDMWSADFVPPNVELTPEDLKDGEVCSRRNMKMCAGNDISSAGLADSQTVPVHTSKTRTPELSAKNCLREQNWND